MLNMSHLPLPASPADNAVAPAPVYVVDEEFVAFLSAADVDAACAFRLL